MRAAKRPVRPIHRRSVMLVGHAMRTEVNTLAAMTRHRDRGNKLDVYTGQDWCRSNGRLMDKTSIFDGKNDRRYEKVTDAETGELVYEYEGRLSEHRGHGSDKN